MGWLVPQPCLQPPFNFLPPQAHPRGHSTLSCLLQRNSFVQFGGSYQPSGCLYSLTPKDEEDLNRSVVRSDRATISIPELEFEIPPRVGEITTVEGLVMAALEGLEKGQVLRRAMQPEVFIALQQGSGAG